MIDSLKKLVHSLQEELKHYGEMLRLLDEQQELVIRRSVDDLMQSVAEVQRHGAVLQLSRQDREKCQRDLAQKLQLDPQATFSEMIPALPEDYRPLMQALVHENNELLFRVQQRARQNHVLLARSLELMQRFMNSLFANCETPVYTDRGNLYQKSTPTNRPLYEAVG